MNTPDIINGCIARNIKAQEALLRTYGSKLKAISIHYSDTKENAQDIFQEGFIKVINDIHQLKNPAALEVWMKRVFINTAMAFYRKKKKLNIVLKDYLSDEGYLKVSDEVYNQSDEETENDYIRSIERFSQDELTSLIKSLGEPQSSIFLMFYIDNLSHSEICEALNISEGNCRVLLHRTKVKLRTRLSEIIKSPVNSSQL